MIFYSLSFLWKAFHNKDSVALLHLCNEVLPLDVPVIFSDTDMELPDTYETWRIVQDKYPKRDFLSARAKTRALDNWKLFGPPSRTIRWCCSIHKSTPALIKLKKIVGKSSIRVMAFVGVRGDESITHRDFPVAALGLGRFNVVAVLAVPQKLVVYPD